MAAVEVGQVALRAGFAEGLALVLQVHVKFDDFSVLFRRVESQFIHCSSHLFKLLVQNGRRLLELTNLLTLSQLR